MFTRSTSLGSSQADGVSRSCIGPWEGSPEFRGQSDSLYASLVTRLPGECTSRYNRLTGLLASDTSVPGRVPDSSDQLELVVGAQLLVKVMGAKFLRSLNSSVVTHLISYEHTGEIAEPGPSIPFQPMQSLRVATAGSRRMWGASRRVSLL